MVLLGFPPCLCTIEALSFTPCSHPQLCAPPALPINASTSVQPVGPCVSSGHGGRSQRPNETWNEFITRQNKRRIEKLLNENDNQRQIREGRERSAAKKSCPGKKGPTVFVWENDNGVWTRTLLTQYFTLPHVVRAESKQSEQSPNSPSRVRAVLGQSEDSPSIV